MPFWRQAVLRMFSLLDGRKQLAEYQRKSNDYVFITFLGFAYTNQDNSKFGENFIQYENDWTCDGIDLVFPFEFKEAFDMENVLPQVSLILLSSNLQVLRRESRSGS